MKTERIKTKAGKIDYSQLVALTIPSLVDGFGFYNDCGVYYKLRCDVDPKDNDADRRAKVLLCGGRLRFIDGVGEVSGDIWRNKGLEYARKNGIPYRVLKDGRSVYTLTLEDIIRGIERAADGSFAGGSDPAVAQKAYRAYKDFMGSKYGGDAANMFYLLQVAIFDDIIYPNSNKNVRKPTVSIVG
jgi:hypothetical protein